MRLIVALVSRRCQVENVHEIFVKAINRRLNVEGRFAQTARAI